MICATIGIEIFISTSLSCEQQGLAGALINTLLFFGLACSVAIGDVVQTQIATKGLKESYQAVFWYQTAAAVLVLVILGIWVKISRAESNLIVDEKTALAELEEKKGI